jgi:retinol dehydrogenase 12
LLAHNAKVYIAVRNEEKSKSAITKLKEQTGKEAIFLKFGCGRLEVRQIFCGGVHKVRLVN